MSTTAPAMFSRSSCIGIKPSRNAFTSAALSSCAGSGTLDSPAAGCCGAGRTGVGVAVCGSAETAVNPNNNMKDRDVRNFIGMNGSAAKSCRGLWWNGEGYHARWVYLRTRRKLWSGAGRRWPPLIPAPVTPNLTVTLDVRPERANACTVLADLCFVAPDHIARRVAAAIHVQAVAVVLQPKLLLAKTFFIGPQIGVRTSLSSRKRTEGKRYSQEEVKAFSQHWPGSEL